MSAISLHFEKETLRNLAGPELFLETGLEPLEPAALVAANGGASSQLTVPSPSGRDSVGTFTVPMPRPGGLAAPQSVYFIKL